jgi:hypothetical protein
MLSLASLLPCFVLADVMILEAAAKALHAQCEQDSVAAQ